MAKYTQTNRPLKVFTALGADAFLLTGFRGREGVSELFSFELDLIAENATPVAFERLLGQKASVALRLGDGSERYFSGMIRRFSRGDHDAEFTSYQAELVPQFWCWTRKVQSRGFQQMTVAEILRKMLEGLDVSFELTQEYPKRQYCVQYQESDFAFASRLMEDEGIHYYFRHTADKPELVVSDAPLHPDVPGANELPYDPAKGAIRAWPRVSSWRTTQEVRAGKYITWDYNFELPDKHVEASASPRDSVAVGQVSHPLIGGVNSDLEIFEYPGGYARHCDGVGPGGEDCSAELGNVFAASQRTARLRAEAEAAQGLAVEAASDAGQLLPGHVFSLTRHVDANGKYLVIGVTHSASSPVPKGDEDQIFEYSNQFTCLPTDLPYRPARRTPKPVIGGTQTATVVGAAGQSTFLDKYGRVKVQFHWDRQGKQDADSSGWVRVAQIWAGNRWGAFFWPRVGHEVVVSFEDGDPDRPLVVGSVYNDKNMPPFEMPVNDVLAGIKSCSVGGDVNAHANFNGILFCDQAGEERVEVHSENQERTRTESDKTIRVGRNLTTVVGALGSTNGSGSGGGLPPGFYHDVWDAIEAHVGWGCSFVVGNAGHVTLGSYGNYVVGQFFTITTNPMALAQYTSKCWGTAAFQGVGTGIAGSVNMVVGGSMIARYGPQINVNRGPRLTTTGEASGLATGLTFLVNGITISANIMAALKPDVVNPYFWGAKAIEAATMGVLCGVEASYAWLSQAEVHNKLAKQYLEFLQIVYTRQLIWQKFKGNNLSEEVKTSMVAAKNAIEGLEEGALVHDCSAYVMSARKRAVLTTHDDDGKMIIVSPQIDLLFKKLGMQGDEISMLSKQGTCFGGKTIEIKGTSDDGEAGFDLDDSSIEASIDNQGPTIKMSRDGGIELRFGNNSLLLDKSGIKLKSNNELLTLNETGIFLHASNIRFLAKMAMKLKAAMMHQSLDIMEVSKTLASIKQ
jgi:type VI secretion system secreted protein VgrG